MRAYLTARGLRPINPLKKQWIELILWMQPEEVVLMKSSGLIRSLQNALGGIPATSNKEKGRG